MTVCSADRIPERVSTHDYDKSELAKVHREDLEAYLGACGGRVLLGDLLVDIPPVLGLDERHTNRLVASAMAKGMLEIHGLTPEVVLRSQQP